jgi:hypothetical protein
VAIAALLFPLGLGLSQLAASPALACSHGVAGVDDLQLDFAGVLPGYAALVEVRARASSPACPVMRTR